MKRAATEIHARWLVTFRPELVWRCARLLEEQSGDE